MDKEKQKALTDFIEYKRTIVDAKNDLYNTKYFLSQFLNSTNKPLKDLTETDIVNFINTKKKYSIGSMNQIKSIIKSFCYWYYEDYSHRFKNLRKIGAAQRTERKYTPEMMWKKEDVEKLVKSENDNYWKAYWMMLFYGGFRPSEVCNLEWKDVVFAKEGAYIKIYVKKNHKNFEKYIPEDVCFYLKKLQQNNSKYVFPTKRKNKHRIPVGDMPLTHSGVFQRLVYVSKKYLDKRINPYVLRHSIATILYNRDDLKDSDVAQQLGHSKAMRETYNNLSAEKTRERMKKIWIQSEDLPPEKKAEYDKQIADLKEQLSKKTFDDEEFKKVYLEKMNELSSMFNEIQKARAELKAKRIEVKA